jgi:hypothetical protein
MPAAPRGSAGGRAKAGRSAKSQVETIQVAFIDDTAVKTGNGHSTIARDVTRGKKAKIGISLALDGEGPIDRVVLYGQ